MPVNMVGGSSDQFGTVRTINTDSNGMQHCSDFLTVANSRSHAEAVQVTRSGTTMRKFEAECEKPVGQTEAARVSTSTKLPVTKLPVGR